MFEKALREVSVELKEELLCDETKEFLKRLYDEIKNELSRAGEVAWSLERFIERIDKEIEGRRIDLRKFRSEKNEPVTNMFKRVIRELAKESNINLSNDSLSRLLNFIRNQYSTGGVLTGALFPAEAFFKREEYAIPDYYETGDDDSCFRDGRCNYGNSLWLEIEDKKYNRVKFVVFHYKSGSKEGWGRCWVYQVSDWAIFATNFYSRGFDIKAQWLKFPVVRILRLLAGLTEKVRFAYGTNIYLPIYLNGDGLIIYEKDQFSHSDEVIELSRKIVSECMYCEKEFTVAELGKYDERVYYSPVGTSVKGLIVCRKCMYDLDNIVMCEDCRRMIFRDNATYIEDVGYICSECFNTGWFYCNDCGEPHRREYVFFLDDGLVLCERCIKKLGVFCESCGKFVYYDEEGIKQYRVNNGHYMIETYLCDHCANELRTYKCECGRSVNFIVRDVVRNDRLRDMVQSGLCLDCYDLEQIFAMQNVIVED